MPNSIAWIRPFLCIRKQRKRPKRRGFEPRTSWRATLSWGRLVLVKTKQTLKSSEGRTCWKCNNAVQQYVNTVQLSIIVALCREKKIICLQETQQKVKTSHILKDYLGLHSYTRKHTLTFIAVNLTFTCILMCWIPHGCCLVWKYVSRVVHPQKSSKVDVKYLHMPVWASHPTLHFL